MAQEQVQPVAFHLVESGLALPLVAMRFPDEWRGPLDNLAALTNDRRRGDRPTSFRIASLNAAIMAFTPQLFITPGQAYRSNDPWLIAREEIRPDKLGRIARAWLAEHYSRREDLAEDYDAAYDALKDEDLVWKPFTLDTTHDPYGNGTARVESLAFAVIPALIASRLIERDVRVPIGATERPLVRVPTFLGGAEVQTWPPIDYQEAGTGRKAWYSYVITIWLQTLVGCSQPRIHMTYGVRRWRSDPLRTTDAIFLSSREGRTVYLRHPQPLSGVPQSSHFTRATIEVRYDASGQRIPVWRDSLAGIAGRIGAALPDPSDITLMPEQYLNPAKDDAIIAAVVEKTPRSHPVGAGMGLEVREAITQAITAGLSDTLVLLPPLIRSNVTGTPQRNQPMLAADLRELSVETRLRAITETIGAETTIEIWYQNPECRDELVYSIHAMLTGDRPEVVKEASVSPLTTQVTQAQLFDTPATHHATDTPKKVKSKRAAPVRPAVDTSRDHTIDLPDGKVLRIAPRPLGELGAMLPEPTEEDLRKRGDYKRRETQKRAEYIAKNVPTTNGAPTLALIELLHFQDSRDRARRMQVGLRDPKRALRLGMALAGRVTKFTQGKFHIDQQGKGSSRSRMSPEELLRERCENAVLEGLRQMGYLPGPITVTPPEGAILPERLVIAGVRMLRLTRKRTDAKIYLPVVTVFDTNTPGVYVWLPDEHVGVRRFHEAMLAITRFKDRDVGSFRQQEMLARLEQFLTTTLPNTFTSDVVILVDAQNMRWLWPGLQNGEIEFDGLQFRKGGASAPVSDFEHRFRLIRLRTSERAETPIWYTSGATPGRNYISGLFRDSEAKRTFYNIAIKPKTQGQARRGKQEAPDEQYAIPSMLEILVAAQQSGDSDDVWALAIHTWRRMGYLSGGDMTLLPIPLQWAQKMDRYAAVIGPWVFRTQEYLWVDDNDISDEDDTGGPEQLSLFGDEEDIE